MTELKMAAKSCIPQRVNIPTSKTKCIFLLLILLVFVFIQLVHWQDFLSFPVIRPVLPQLRNRIKAGSTWTTATGERTGNGSVLSEIHTRETPTGVHAQEHPNTSQSSSGVGSPSPTFHKKWNADCFKIVKGNEAEIQRVVRILSLQRMVINHKHKEPLMPPDDDVLGWTQDCTAFRRARGYPQHPLSSEEAAFPIAYIIVVHKYSAQVERLLRAIYQPQNIHCIHVDDKSTEVFKGAVAGLASCFENVFVASKAESVHYAGFTRLLADINCMRDLATGPAALDYPWKYAINLCGQDFPLKSNLEIVRTLQSYNGHNDIGVDEPPSYKRKWTGYRHVAEDRHMVRTRERKEPAPRNLTVFSGVAYYIASRRFVDYVLNNQTAKDLLEWTKDTYSPDENYWPTLQAAGGTPGGRWHAPNGSAVRFIRWYSYGRSSIPRCRGHTIRSICVFSMGYVQHLVSRPHLFANKFDYTFDPVALQCLEEHIENKTRHEVANHLNVSTVSSHFPKH